MIERILIVDDSALARSIIHRVLEISGLSGVEIKEANDGLEALQMLSEQSYDMVFTDLNMPKMGGMEFLKNIRDEENIHNFPVVVISSVTTPSKKMELISAGAEAVFKKPISIPEITSFLQKYLDEEEGEEDEIIL